MQLKDFNGEQFDMQKLNDLGLVDNEDLNDKFTNVYQIYTKFLEEYICEKIELKEYDTAISGSPLLVKSVSKDERDIYQYLSSFDYFYIRNTLHIERLSKSEIEELNEKFLGGNLTYDVAAKSIIESTYKDVIKDSNYKDGTNINYGPSNNYNFYAPNNALVIGVRYDPEYDNGNAANWKDNFYQKEVLFNTVIDLINEEGKGNLDVPVCAIRYDENTVYVVDSDIVERVSNIQK